MTSSIRILVRRILVVLLVILLPAAARSQEPSQPAQAGTQKSEAQPSSAPSSPEQKPEPAAPAAAPAAAAEQATEQTTGTYIIKQGDTLWDISSSFLKDPFLWPFIWKANPSITNADLIYPGNTLIIPSMAPIERALAAPAAAPEQAAEPAPSPEPAAVAAEPALVDARTESGAEGGLFGRKKVAHENAPSDDKAVSHLFLPEIVQTPLADRTTVLRAGFVSFDESKDRVVGVLDGEKTIFSYNDIVYVNISSKQASPGDKFLIFTPLHRVRHPVTRVRYGQLIRVDGVLEIVAAGTGGNYTARIIVSLDTASRKSMLLPYQDPPLIFGNPPAKNKDIEGYVIDIRQDQTISSQNDCIYLDKGTVDGVELGDRFVIYSIVEKTSYPKNKVGEAQVIVVKDKTATALVHKSMNTLVIGDKVEYKK